MKKGNLYQCLVAASKTNRRALRAKTSGKGKFGGATERKKGRRKEGVQAGALMPKNAGEKKEINGGKVGEWGKCKGKIIVSVDHPLCPNGSAGLTRIIGRNRGKGGGLWRGD